MLPQVSAAGATRVTPPVRKQPRITVVSRRRDGGRLREGTELRRHDASLLLLPTSEHLRRYRSDSRSARKEEVSTASGRRVAVRSHRMSRHRGKGRRPEQRPPCERSVVVVCQRTPGPGPRQRCCRAARRAIRCRLASPAASALATSRSVWLRSEQFCSSRSAKDDVHASACPSGSRHSPDACVRAFTPLVRCGELSHPNWLTAPRTITTVAVTRIALRRLLVGFNDPSESCGSAASHASMSAVSAGRCLTPSTLSLEPSASRSACAISSADGLIPLGLLRIHSTLSRAPSCRSTASLDQMAPLRSRTVDIDRVWTTSVPGSSSGVSPGSGCCRCADRRAIVARIAPGSPAVRASAPYNSARDHRVSTSASVWIAKSQFVSVGDHPRDASLMVNNKVPAPVPAPDSTPT